MPSLFTLPLGVPASVGVPASLGGVPGLEPGSVLCDAEAVAVALAGAGVCTRCHGRANVARPARHSVSSEKSSRQTRAMKHQPYLVCNCARHRQCQHRTQAVGRAPLEKARTVCGRRRISSCSALPPGATAVQHQSQCRPALRRTASTPGHVEF